MKKALITGIIGQDGSYLADFLFKKGFEIYGIKSRSSLFNTHRIDHIYHDPNYKNNQFQLHYARYFRPTEVETLLGDVSKAKKELVWKPEITVLDLCKDMVLQDYKGARRMSLLNGNNLKLPFSIED